MMRKFMQYKHEKCTDLVVECVKCFLVPGKNYYRVKLKYLTLCFDRKTVYNTGEQETVTITKEAMRLWRPWFPETHNVTNHQDRLDG